MAQGSAGEGLHRDLPRGYPSSAGKDADTAESPGRPGHPPSAEQVKVQVEDELPRLLSIVGHQAKVAESNPTGHRGALRDDLPQEGRVRLTVAHVLDVLLGDDQNVGRSLGIDVLERQYAFVLEDFL